MTGLQQLWLASAVGAVVFFAAGALLASLRRRGPVAEVAVQRVNTIEIDQLRQRAETADLRVAELRAEQRSDARLNDRLATAERELTERTAQLREAASQLDVMKARISDAEAMRTEYVRLRTQANEMEFLGKEVARLKDELRAAKSLAIGGVKKIPPRAVKPAASAATGSITEALAGAIERFSDPKMRSIAIVDKVGFPVSSSGDDGAELAGYVALLHDVATRASQFLPIALPASIEVIDEHGARISVWPFDVADERLLLANLGVGATEATRVERMLSEVVGILAPSVTPPPVPGVTPRPAEPGH